MQNQLIFSRNIFSYAKMSVEAATLDLKSDLKQNVETLLRVSSKDLEVLMKHYDVTNEILIEMIKSFRGWYEKQPHLPKDQLHDRQILGHLLLRGFSLERVKKNIESFYTARRRIPELMCGRNMDDKEWKSYLERGYWIVAPKKTADNNRVAIFRINSGDNGDSSQILKVGFLMFEYRVWNDFSYGDYWILDFKHATLHQGMQFTPILISKIIYIMSSCYGPRLKKVYLLNMPSFASTIMNLFKRGIKTKLADRIHVIQAKDLLDIFSKDILPEEYGGTEVSCKKITDEWLKTFQTEAWKKYLVEQDTVCVDDSKRLTPSPADEIFGVDGSFRQLCLD